MASEFVFHNVDPSYTKFITWEIMTGLWLGCLCFLLLVVAIVQHILKENKNVGKASTETVDASDFDMPGHRSLFGSFDHEIHGNGRGDHLRGEPHKPFAP